MNNLITLNKRKMFNIKSSIIDRNQMNNLGDNNFKLNLTTLHKGKRYTDRDVKTF